MNVAVTAASGNPGSAIIRHLISIIGKENVLAKARNPEKPNTSA
jgi:NAD(P)H dehydrogenase (quinone)